MIVKRSKMIYVSVSRARPGSTVHTDYLVAEDKDDPSTWHLPVMKNGTPDHRLMGAAWAALYKTHRGQPYKGPNKGEAKKKLIALYKKIGQPHPTL